MLKFQHVSFIAAFVFIAIEANCQGFEKLPEDQVDQTQTKLAKEFAHNFFSTLKEGKTYEFHDEVTKQVNENLTPETQKQLYQYITEQFGNYQSLKYVETWKYSGDGNMIIVRFKGICDKDKEIPEIRVVLDKDNKIAGFWLKPWADEMK
jgi:hypothetical protein